MPIASPFRSAVDEADAQPLLAAIQQAPFDDAAPSIAFAKWLIARDYPRGEHLALACERWHYKNPVRFAENAPRFAALEPVAASWFATLQALGARDWSHDDEPTVAIKPLRALRGMIVRAQLVGDDVANVGALLRSEPISELRLVDATADAAAIAAACAELARLRILAIAATNSAALLYSPHLGALQSLTTDANDPETIAALATSSAQPTRLVLPRITATGLAALVRAPIFARVQELALPHAQLDDREAAAVLAMAPRTPLFRLDLSHSRLGAATLAALGDRLRTLYEIDLGHTALDTTTATALVQHVGSSLFALRLAGNRDATAVAQLLRSPLGTQLTALDLRGAAYARRDLVFLLRRSKMQRTRFLPLFPWEGDRAIANAYPALQLIDGDV